MIILTLLEIAIGLNWWGIAATVIGGLILYAITTILKRNQTSADEKIIALRQDIDTLKKDYKELLDKFNHQNLDTLKELTDILVKIAELKK